MSWITIGENKTHVEVNGKGDIVSGPASLKGESIKSLSDKTRNPVRSAKAAHAKAEGKTGRDYTAKEAADLGSDKKVWQHEAAKAATVKGVAAHRVIGQMKPAHDHLTAIHEEREAAKETARKVTGLNAGNIAKLENTYRDHSTRKGFDAAARTVAETHRGLGFDPDSTDTPGKVWDLIREGAKPKPQLHDREVAELAAEWAIGSKSSLSLTSTSTWAGDGFDEPSTPHNSKDDFVPFSSNAPEWVLFGSPDQPRDENGRFASGGGSSGGSVLKQSASIVGGAIGSAALAATGLDGWHQAYKDLRSRAQSSSDVANKLTAEANQSNRKPSAKVGDHLNAAGLHELAAQDHVTAINDENKSYHRQAYEYHTQQQLDQLAKARSVNMQNKFSLTRSVPFEAITFGGDIWVNSQTFSLDLDSLAERPITIKARTSSVGYQKYWGRCVHDMAGFHNPGKPVPLDYDHQPGAAIGVADRVEVVDGDLIAHSRLVPFSKGDQADKIIYHGTKGVPYQASIVMSLDGLEVEEVPEGKTVAVNGGEFSGPGAVFRKWGIDGIAVTPYGADSKTSVQFSRDFPDVEISVFTLKESEPMVDPVIGATIAPNANAAPAVDTSKFINREDLAKFKTDFGAAGVDWCFDGKTYAEAAKLFSDGLKAELETLKTSHASELAAKDATISELTTERDALKVKSEFNRGKAAPVPNKPNDGATAPAEKQNFGLQGPRAALAASILKRMQPSKN